MLEAQVSQRTSAARTARAPHRRTQPVAALKAGLAAGAATLFLLQFVGVVVYDESPWKLLRMVAAMACGPGALEPDDEFDGALVAIGLSLFFALSMLYALALSHIVTDLQRRYAPAAGLAFGAALYYANFHGFTAIFPWLAAYRTVDTLLAHLVFGLAAARAYLALRRRGR
ncbi:MAG: hypothetical protein ACXWHA_05500 [Usitatibacter sp.]